MALGILDSYTAKVAFALRRLKSTYSGYCLRVRRSDNTEADIGFDSSGICNWSAVTTFAAGGSVWVKTWYDQSGNSLDLTQSVNSKQPKLNLTTHKIEFDGMDDRLSSSTIDLSGTNQLSLYYKINRLSALGGYEYWVQLRGTVNSCLLDVDGVLGLTTFNDYDGDSNFKSATSGNSATGTERIWSAIIDRTQDAGNGLRFYCNGTEQTYSSSSQDQNGNFDSNAILTIGTESGESAFANISISDAFIFVAPHNSTDRGVIESDISNGLGAYTAVAASGGTPLSGLSGLSGVFK